MQKERAGYWPKLPKAPQGVVKIQEGAPIQSVDNQEDIKKLFPNTCGMPLVEFVPADSVNDAKINIDIILSDGQAPGDHNVISSFFDEVKKLDPENRLYGFLIEPGSLVDHNYTEITAENLQAHCNTSGFGMIGSGRTKLEKEGRFEKGLEVLRKLDIKAVIIIGDDDSSTNACVLAEYYTAKQYGVQAIGRPKTIDDDLKNDQIEISFGFDTATKAYPELIGNIERDCNSARKYWHFIKLVGRSASHIALEYALQTRPNVCSVSEGIESKDQTLNDIVEYTAGVVACRAEQGSNFDVVLVPKGLIEFIPAIGCLIQKLSGLLAAHGADYLNLDKDAQCKYILEHLSAESKATFGTLPEGVIHQLSLDRGPHGNVQVSLIGTEKLISEMVIAKLNQWKKEGKYARKFSPLHYFFGYESRCVAPSNFDANYCYALGPSAARLITNGRTDYITIVKNTTASAGQWKAGDVPITMMVNMERRNGEMKPAICKAFVELDGAPFRIFAAQREKWARETCYIYPGPIQYWGPSSVCDQTAETLGLEQAK